MSNTSETDTHGKNRENNVPGGLKWVINQVQVLIFNCQRKVRYQITEIDSLPTPHSYNQSKTLGCIVEMIKHIHKMKNKTTSQSFHKWTDTTKSKCCYLKL